LLLQIERQIAKFRSGSQKQVQEMTVELKSWQQQESTYQKLIHEHAEMSKKASESIPETKEKIKRLQGKIETANKDINEVRNSLKSREIAASGILTGCSIRASKRRSSTSREHAILKPWKGLPSMCSVVSGRQRKQRVR
jgi:lipid II:glycine glycyltransferase (peptidoglycan interpeptide bridge formation enzyme)